VAVSNWLSGRNEPNMRNLLRLSTALRTDLAELLTDDPGSTSS
jgi:transcriptional regulator with XRE-family HTH domain